VSKKTDPKKDDLEVTKKDAAAIKGGKGMPGVHQPGSHQPGVHQPGKHDKV
jgi:hypothetical protein